jgi:hypothetical protein
MASTGERGRLQPGTQLMRTGRKLRTFEKPYQEILPRQALKSL